MFGGRPNGIVRSLLRSADHGESDAGLNLSPARLLVSCPLYKYWGILKGSNNTSSYRSVHTTGAHNENIFL